MVLLGRKTYADFPGAGQVIEYLSEETVEIIWSNPLTLYLGKRRYKKI